MQLSIFAKQCWSRAHLFPTKLGPRPPLPSSDLCQAMLCAHLCQAMLEPRPPLPSNARAAPDSTKQCLSRVRRCKAMHGPCPTLPSNAWALPANGSSLGTSANRNTSGVLVDGWQVGAAWAYLQMGTARALPHMGAYQSRVRVATLADHSLTRPSCFRLPTSQSCTPLLTSASRSSSDALVARGSSGTHQMRKSRAHRQMGVALVSQ